MQCAFILQPIGEKGQEVLLYILVNARSHGAYLFLASIGHTHRSD